MRAPLRSAAVDKAGQFVRTWANFMASLEAVVTTRTHVQKTNQNAAIAATALATIAGPDLHGPSSVGLYRISYYVRVTTAAGTSSSVQVTLAWTEGGQNLTSVGANLNGNTVTTFETRSIMVRIDPSTTPSFSATYASNAAGVMKFEIDVVLEQIPEAT